MRHATKLRLWRWVALTLARAAGGAAGAKAVTLLAEGLRQLLGY